MGRVPEPFIWGLYEGESTTYREFATVAEVVEFLRDKDWLVYAHNGGRFDYHYLRDYINLDEPLTVIGGRLAKFRIGDCEFRDSMNLFNESLAKFEKTKIDYSLMEADKRDIPKNRETIREYLRSDCINLYRLVLGFIERYGLHLTQAGAAMRFWSRTFNVEMPRQSEHHFQRLQPFYYGGRVQCFGFGHVKTDFKVVDINSAYPFAMMRRHPYASDSVIKLGMPKKPDELGPCMVRVKAISRGALPVRGDDGSLYFPYDERTVREYFVTGWEILAGLETDTLRIVKLVECHVFDRLIAFTDYVQHFYEARKVAKAGGDILGDLFSKRMMNALYGKFAANPSRYSEYMLSSEERYDDWRGKGFQDDEQWAHARLLSRPLDFAKRHYYNVATAASITGFVRAHLWRALMACEGPIYCDTDSIAARNVSNLDSGSALGQWKVEAECDEYAIAGKKLYAFRKTDAWFGDEYKKWEASSGDGKESAKPEQWKIACKGVDLDSDAIKKVASGSEVEYSPDVPTYSIHKGKPVFVPRKVRSTYKDISKLGEPLNVS